MLKPLLSDGSSYVRTRAAAALDPSRRSSRITGGFRGLRGFDVPASRLVAAEAMASRPDEAWMALATELATAGGDPEVRLRAAKLIAPRNPDLARSVAQELSSDGNPAIREFADSLVIETVSEAGLAILRSQLRARDDLVRLHAATRVLVSTR